MRHTALLASVPESRSEALPTAAADPINEAVAIYTAFGKSPFPRARSNDLIVQYGPERGAELKLRIVALLEDLQQSMPTGEKRSRKSVTEQAIEQFRPRHPELDESALKALAWTFSFGMR